MRCLEAEAPQFEVDAREVTQPGEGEELESPYVENGLLELRTWARDALALARPLEFLWQYDLDIAPDALWPFVADTSHFNRALGMGPMDYREVDGVLHGSTRNGGVLQEWRELRAFRQEQKRRCTTSCSTITWKITLRSELPCAPHT